MHWRKPDADEAHQNPAVSEPFSDQPTEEATVPVVWGPRSPRGTPARPGARHMPAGAAAVAGTGGGSLAEAPHSGAGSWFRGAHTAAVHREARSSLRPHETAPR